MQSFTTLTIQFGKKTVFLRSVGQANWDDELHLWQCTCGKRVLGSAYMTEQQLERCAGYMEDWHDDWWAETSTGDATNTMVSNWFKQASRKAALSIAVF